MFINTQRLTFIVEDRKEDIFDVDERKITNVAGLILTCIHRPYKDCVVDYSRYVAYNYMYSIHMPCFIPTLCLIINYLFPPISLAILFFKVRYPTFMLVAKDT
jgi:hypothetical protein